MAFRFGRKNAIPMMLFIEMARIRAAEATTEGESEENTQRKGEVFVGIGFVRTTIIRHVQQSVCHCEIQLEAAHPDSRTIF